MKFNLYITLLLLTLLGLNQACHKNADASSEHKKSSDAQVLEIQNETDEDSSGHEPVVIRTGILTGDVILQTSQSSQSRAIQMATNSKFSHVGMVFLSKSDTVVLEAVQPVKFTKFREFVNRGEKSEYTLMRLKDRSPITPQKQSELKITGDQYVGIDYDWLFDWSDDKLYCSELVYKMYKNVLDIELCAPKPLKEYSLNGDLVRQKLSERYGKSIPLDELMVSPEDIYQSDMLMVIKP